MIVLAVVAVLVLGALVLTYFQSRRTGEPFANPQFSRITGDGTTGLAAVSPERRIHRLYNPKKGLDASLEAQSRHECIDPVTAPIQGDAVSLEFTDSGNRIAFALHPALQVFHRNLFTVPLEGGTPVQILGELPGPVGISRDGTKAAIVRANRPLNRDEIWIADLKNGGERLITSRQYPTHLLSQASPAWSRDGKLARVSCRNQGQCRVLYLSADDRSGNGPGTPGAITPVAMGGGHRMDQRELGTRHRCQTPRFFVQADLVHRVPGRSQPAARERY